MIVLDASAAVAALLSEGVARRTLSQEQVHVPHLVDSEVASTLRRRVAAGTMDAGDGWALLDVWRRLGMTRYPVAPLLDRVWQLRENVTAYDAAYVALAEALGYALLTGDGRLGRVPGVRCPVTVLPN